MKEILTKIQESARHITENEFNNNDNAIVLGTVLGSFLNYVDVTNSNSFQEIPNFPESTVGFHKDNLELCNNAGKKEIVL